MTMPDLDTLDKLAAEAERWPDDDWYTVPPEMGCIDTGNDADNAYIAAADPTTIRALIAHVRELEAALTVDALAEAILVTATGRTGPIENIRAHAAKVLAALLEGAEK